MKEFVKTMFLDLLQIFRQIFFYTHFADICTALLLLL